MSTSKFKTFNMLLTFLTPILVLLQFSFALPGLNIDNTPQPRALQVRQAPITNHELVPTTLFEFPNPTWLENFVVRSNGELVITLLTEPSIYLFDPISQSAPTKLFTLSGYVGLLGIVEATPDVFYFVAGNLTNGITVPGTYSLFKFDLHTSAPLPIKVIDMPKASFLNGLEVLRNDDGQLVLIVADSASGLVWKVDVSKGEYEVFIDIPEMKIAVNTSLAVGINGLHLRDSFLYFTSMSQELFCRICIQSNKSGYQIGPTEILASGIVGDDFTLDQFGNGWIAENPMDKLTLVIGNGKKKGEVVTIAGAIDKPLVAGGTRCAFGRTRVDKNILYLITNGGIFNPPSSGVVGGKILAFDTTGYLTSL